MLCHRLFSITLATTAAARCIHRTSFWRRQEEIVQVANFNYTGESGPLNWAALDPANAACRTSRTQSPIVLDHTIPFAQTAPHVEIPSVAAAQLDNLGSTLEVPVEGTTTFEGVEYALVQFHFHTPSEHRVHEEYFPLEMHLVHEAVRTFSRCFDRP